MSTPEGWDFPADLAKDPAGIPDPASVSVPDELRAEIEDYMARYPDRHSAALPALTAAQQRHGWCSPEALEQVACVMRVTKVVVMEMPTAVPKLRKRPKTAADSVT